MARIANKTRIMNKPWFICGGLLFALLLMSFYGFCSDAFATQRYSLSMSTSGAVEIDVANTTNNFGAAVASDSVTVVSTCPHGYTVSISGPNDRNLYKNGSASNNTSGTYIAPSSGTAANPVPITGNNINTWGYSLTSSDGTGNFIGLPSTQTTLTTKNSASASGGDVISVHYGVSVSSSITPGIYKMANSGAITYYLTTSENCTSYQVQYNANGNGNGTSGNDVTGSMANQRIYEGITDNLTNNAYSKTDYLFAGWNTAANGSGTHYENGATVTDLTTANSTITLYAEWATPMQDFTMSECSSKASSHHAYVYDRRDNTIYTVRYIDGGCWMTKNLLITGTVASTYSNFNGSSVNITVSDITGSDTYTEPRTHSENDNTGDPAVWYNYPAATAGTITENSNSNDATQDVCPKSWRLPTSTEFTSIYSNVSAFEPVYGGIRYSSGSHGERSTRGRWWSSTTSSASQRYSLDYNNGSMGSNQDYRSRGIYIRCIKTKDYMQDVTSSSLAKLMPNNGDTVTLYDKRDDNSYTVAKINNNYWMTQNLRLGPGTYDRFNSNTYRFLDHGTYTDYFTLPNNDLSSNTSCNNTSAITVPCMKESGDDDIGNWYNYCATTATRGCWEEDDNDDEMQEATESICPKEWKLPSLSQLSGITSYASSFNPVAGGVYINGNWGYKTYGYWWSNEAYSSTQRYGLDYNGSTLTAGGYSRRSVGRSVRCIFGS